MIEIFCFVISITRISGLNTRKDDDDLKNINMKWNQSNYATLVFFWRDSGEPVRTASTQQEPSKCKSVNLHGTNYT
jgi:hypothetical protein